MEREFFARVDQDASDVLTLLNRDVTVLTPGQRNGWSRFLMSLLHRHPARVDRLWQLATKQYWASIDLTADAYRKHRSPDDPETFDEYKVQRQESLVGQLFAMVLKELSDSERIGQRLNGMVSEIISVDGRERLLTSDCPLVLTGPLESPRTVLMLPIGPRRVFLASNQEATSASVRGMAEDGSLVKRLNLALTRQAYKHVYGVCENHLPLVTAHMGAEPPAWFAPLNHDPKSAVAPS